jgi:SAM-dependent methyltransferase
MEAANPVELLFAEMGKLGPGSDPDTLYVLRSLPRHRFDVIVDAGCGAGRQTFVLAKEIGSPVDAIDSYQPFLNRLQRRAKQNGAGHLVRTHCMDMKDIPRVFPDVDLLWSEGAAYHIGFANALSIWAKAIKPDGFAVVSELCWLRTEEIPNEVWDFFQTGYPDIRSVPENIAIAEDAGYKIFNIYTLPNESWVKDYYEVLEPRAQSLLVHPDPAAREFAAETIKEIETFKIAEDSYGYVFYILQRKS